MPKVNRKKAKVTISISQFILEKTKEVADRLGMSVSDVIEDATTRYLESLNVIKEAVHNANNAQQTPTTGTERRTPCRNSSR
jgi:metal-responsive CopG/Arc/MetJ family transcriptional regulator